MDIPLAEQGQTQARRLAERLRDERITLAYSSDLRRASETASLALAGRDIRLSTTADLREMHFGTWEGLSHAEIAARDSAAWSAWTADPARSVPPGGTESLAGLRARLVKFLENAQEQANTNISIVDPFGFRAAGQAAAPSERATVLIVSHGGPIRALLTHFFAIPVERYWQFGIRPASVTILELYRQGAIAEVIGDTSHLGMARTVNDW
jgi:broad specificity phosphatase PhoE